MSDRPGPPVIMVERFGSTVPELARRLRPGFDSGTDVDRRRTLLGIVGEPGAGKSTVAQALVHELGARAVQVPMDGFHLADVALRAHGTLDRKGAPETFDGWGYLELVRRLRHELDHPIYAPAFERDLEQPLAGAIEIGPEQVFVVSEGNYLLMSQPPWPDVAELFDQIWFVRMDAEERLRRLIARHVEFGKSPAQARSWVLTGDERNAELIRATADRADLVLDTSRLALPRHVG